MKDFENEIPKHKKKKNSSISKSKEKSKHKHEYTGCCLLKYPGIGQTKSMCLASYCVICGKKLNFSIPTIEDETLDNGSLHKPKRLMTEKEILEHYKDLEIIEVECLWQKYIPISKRGE